MAVALRRGLLSASARARLTRLLQGPAVEDVPEMKTLASIQELTTRVQWNTPALGENVFATWLNKQQTPTELDPTAFDALIKDTTSFLQSEEDAVLQDQPKLSACVLEGEEKTVIVEKYSKALQLKLVRLKCDHVRQLFAELDQDKDGKVATKDVQELLRTLVEGSGDDWLRCQFRLYDTDGDEIVTESESQKILDSMILTQKAVLAELFATHVDQMPKKHMKLLDSAVNETNWKEKLPEKVRCVFYFAPKEDEEDKTVCWEAFKESKEAELPELNDIVRVYAKGYYDDRHLFFERKQEKRSLRVKGAALTIALAVSDFVLSLT